MQLTSKKILSAIYPPRPATARKYNYGHLLVISGSYHYTGAPSLVCLAALRAGVDVVTLVAPERAAGVAAFHSPSIISRPLTGDFFTMKHFDEVISLAHKKTAIAIGPGLGRKKETIKFARRLIAKIDIPIVIDADAIYAFEKIQNKKYKIKNTVFTPHAREFKALCGQKVHVDKNKKIKLVKKTAAKLNATILLKGDVDIISNGSDVVLNKTGSPYMTSGGTGDVLCGIIGALLAQKHSVITAAQAGAYISGAAGKLASKKFGPSLIATDVINEIQHTIIDKN